jgi:ATP-dependent RNA helicase DDX46/PRP5
MEKRFRQGSSDTAELLADIDYQLRNTYETGYKAGFEKARKIRAGYDDDSDDETVYEIEDKSDEYIEGYDDGFEDGSKTTYEKEDNEKSLKSDSIFVEKDYSFDTGVKRRKSRGKTPLKKRKSRGKTPLKKRKSRGKTPLKKRKSRGKTPLKKRKSKARR